MADDGDERVPTEPEPGDDLPARLLAERRRIYATSAWVGPVGTAALTLIVSLLIRDRIDADRVLLWAVPLAVAVLGQVASITVGPVRRWVSRDGLPVVTHGAHLLIGVCYGALLWIDPTMIADAELRWFGLMTVFAMTAGVSTGLVGLHTLGLRVVAPMLALAGAALASGGHWLMASGVLLFLVIEVVDQRRSGRLWSELVTLRVDHERHADEQRWLAQHDALTGLLNRAGILERIDGARRRTTTGMFVDLDHFKQVNDEHGHAAGDEVLVEIARRLTSLIRDDDAIGRLGGDEFFIVFDRTLTDRRASELGASIIELVEVPIVTSSGVATVSASVGVTTVGGEAASPELLMSQSDQAMLCAKRAGRGHVVVFERSRSYAHRA